MRTPEAKLWDSLRRNMRWGKAQRIESGLTASGIPDLCYTTINGDFGFLELKVMPKKPKKVLDNDFKIPHYTPEQRNWILSYGQITGLVYLLLKVDDEFYLFNYLGCQLLGLVPYDSLSDLCVGKWSNRIDYSELYALLSVKINNKLV